jgi:hypothetical protein
VLFTLSILAVLEEIRGPKTGNKTSKSGDCSQALTGNAGIDKFVNSS